MHCNIWKGEDTIDCLGVNSPLRHYFSLCRVVREGGKQNGWTSHTYCNHRHSLAIERPNTEHSFFFSSLLPTGLSCKVSRCSYNSFLILRNVPVGKQRLYKYDAKTSNFACLKMYGYTPYLTSIITQWDNLVIYHFASLEHEALPKHGFTLKGNAMGENSALKNWATEEEEVGQVGEGKGAEKGKINIKEFVLLKVNPFTSK